MKLKHLTVRRCLMALVLCVMAQVCLGCGYSMKSSLDEKYQTIYVEPFKNSSREYDMQAPLTTAVTRKFLNDGRLRVVQKHMADLVVSGTIQEYELKERGSDSNDETTQYEMRMRTTVRVIDPRNGDELWSGPVNTITYFTTLRSETSSHRLRGNTQITLPVVRSFQTDAENRAASEALEVVASDIFYRTIEPW